MVKEGKADKTAIHVSSQPQVFTLKSFRPFCHSLSVSTINERLSK